MIRIAKLNLLFISLILLWQIIQLSILSGFDGKGRIMFTLSILCIITNVIYNRKNFFSGSIKWYFLWFFYALINTYFQYSSNYSNVDFFTFSINRLILPLTLVLSIQSFEKKDLNKLLKYMQFVFFISILIILFNLSDVKGNQRYGLEKFNAVEMVLYPVTLTILLSVRYIFKQIKLINYIVMLIISLLIVILTGSRMGFGMFLIIIVGTIYVNIKNKYKYPLLMMIIPFLLLFVGFQFLIENTYLGERLVSTTSSLEDSRLFYLVDGTVFQYLGDRGLFYILGWDLFLDNPIFGIGLLNFPLMNDYIIDVLHSEYMVQLTELGIIGFSMYIIYNYKIFKCNLLLSREYDKRYYFFIFIHISILFAASSLYLYKQLPIAVLYGILISVSKNKIKVTNKI